MPDPVPIPLEPPKQKAMLGVMGGPTTLWQWGCGCSVAHVQRSGPYQRERSEGVLWDLAICPAHRNAKDWLHRAAWGVRRSKHMGHVLLRATYDFEALDSELHDQGWMPTSDLVRLAADVPFRSVPTPPGVVLRAGTSADRAAVAGWFAQALSLGTHPALAADLTARHYQRRGREIVEALLQQRSPIVVAVGPDGPIGHASFVTGFRDPNGGPLLTEILDVFVEESWRGRGVSQALTSRVVQASRAVGDPSVRGTVSRVQQGSLEQIRASLRLAGWRPAGGRALNLLGH